MHEEKKPVSEPEYQQALLIVSNPDDFTGKQVKDANAIIEKYKKDQIEDLPF